METVVTEQDAIPEEQVPSEHVGERVGSKVLTLADAAISDSGEFSGYANVFGIVDDGGDKVIRGAFKSAIPAFVKDGFIGWSHDWTKLIATIDSAAEDDHGLLIKATFHGTPEAQTVRQLVSERLARGKSMGLSIGYEIGEAKGAPYGRDIHSFRRLFETSFVAVPMNRPSNVTAIKGALGSGLPYAERFDLVLDEAAALLQHSRSRHELRQEQKVGRTLSAASRERVARFVALARELADDGESLLAETDPDSPKAAANAAVIAWVINEARLNGVPLD